MWLHAQYAYVGPFVARAYASACMWAVMHTHDCSLDSLSCGVYSLIMTMASMVVIIMPVGSAGDKCVSEYERWQQTLTLSSLLHTHLFSVHVVASRP